MCIYAGNLNQYDDVMILFIHIIYLKYLGYFNNKIKGIQDIII